MLKNRFLALLVLFFTLPTLSAAESMSAIGRYLSVENAPRHAQKDLLSQIIQMHFPSSVQTVGDAIHYCLQYSGYSLIPANLQSQALKSTLLKPLPLVDRILGPMTLEDGLETLAGPAYELVQDPLNRLVDFQIRPRFAELYATHPLSHHTHVKRGQS